MEKFDLKRIRCVALDISINRSSSQSQEEVTNFIWSLLQRNYSLILFSTREEQNLDDEDFNHPRLSFVNEEMPPSQATLKNHPNLASAQTLWITDEPQMHAWLEEGGNKYSYKKTSEFVSRNGLRINHLSELGALLDPTKFVVEGVATMLRDLKQFHQGKALLVGIGGPSESGYQEFSIKLRTHLQDSGFELVDLMDLSLLMVDQDNLSPGEAASSAPLWSSSGGTWFRESVLEPLVQGKEIYFEHPPKEVTGNFSAHFPLYVSRESVLLIFSEMLFSSPLFEALHLSMVLELSPEESTRKLYEIPPDESFDPKFTAQYMEREGKVYKNYLKENSVLERVTLRINADHPNAFHFLTENGTPLV